MYSSTAGWIPSLVIAVVVLVPSWKVLADIRHDSELGEVFGPHALGLGAAAFCAVFAVLNLLVQPNVITGPLLHAEVENGALALRVVSVTAAPTFVVLLLAALKTPKFVVDFSGQRPEDDRVRLREYERQLKRWPVGTALSQATVLLLLLCALWDLQIRRQDSVTIALLSWSFLLTVDVFFMAASYRAERGVLPTTFHGMLLLIVGTVTFGLFCSVVFQRFATWLAVVMVLLVVFFLILPGIARFANRGLIWAKEVADTFDVYEEVPDAFDVDVDVGAVEDADEGTPGDQRETSDGL